MCNALVKEKLIFFHFIRLGKQFLKYKNKANWVCETAFYVNNILTFIELLSVLEAPGYQISFSVELQVLEGRCL